MARTRPYRLWVPALVLASALLAPALGAQPRSSKAQARAQFEAADLLYKQGKFREALAGYHRALGLDRHPFFIFNIAQCHRQLREYKKAIFFYRLYLAERPSAANRDEVRQWIAQMQQALAARAHRRRQKGRLSIATTPPGAAVFVDTFTGAPRGRSPALLTLRSGEHLVLIKRPGFRDLQRTVTIRTGKITLLQVALSPITARVVRAASPRAARRPYHRRWWFWTGVAVAGVALVSAVATGVTTLRMRSEWRKNQGPPPGDPGFRTRFNALRLSTDLLLGTAAAVTLATVIGAVVAARSRRERATTSVAPACGPTGCGVVLQGRW